MLSFNSFRNFTTRYRVEILVSIIMVSLFSILILVTISFTQLKANSDTMVKNTQTTEDIIKSLKANSNETKDSVEQNQKNLEELQEYLSCILIVPVAERSNAVQESCRKLGVAESEPKPSSKARPRPPAPALPQNPSPSRKPNSKARPETQSQPQEPVQSNEPKQSTVPIPPEQKGVISTLLSPVINLLGGL